MKKSRKKTYYTKDPTDVTKEINWLMICAAVFLLGMAAGNIYNQTQVNEPERIRQDYEYCVKGCKISRDFQFYLQNQSQSMEVLDYLEGKLVTDMDSKHKKCELDCDKMIREELV